MTIRKPLISSSEVVNEKRRWTQDWYTWISDLVTDILSVETDVSTIQTDITTIQGDITTIQGDITTINGDITTINGQITTINGQITTINAALAGPSNQVGFSNGSNAPAGDVGEYLSSFVLVGAAVSLTANTDTQVTSLALTAGDWDLWGEVYFHGAGGFTVNAFAAAINTSVSTAVTIPADGVDLEVLAGVDADSTASLNGMRTRVNISSPTTYRLIANADFAGGTFTGYGALRARRMR